MLHDALARVGAEGGAVLAECLHAAYDATLRPHQDPFTRRVVAAAIWAAPSRADFLARLGSHREGVRGCGGRARGQGLRSGLETSREAVPPRRSRLRWWRWRPAWRPH